MKNLGFALVGAAVIVGYILLSILSLAVTVWIGVTVLRWMGVAI